MQTLIRPNRDLRIDFFRGVALWCMFIDHLIRGWLRAITIMRYGFCDSAELFVLLSGISAGMVYGGMVARKGLPAARRRLLSRCVVLYRTQLIMLAVMLVEAALLYKWLRPPTFLEFNRLEGFTTEPLRNLLRCMAMIDQPRCLDILPLYLVLLLALCAVLPWTIRWPRWTLALSFALYAGTRIFHWHIPGVAASFNPFAWQLLFFTGVVARHVFTAKQNWRTLDIAASFFTAFGLLESQASHLARLIPAPIWLHLSIDKPDLHPLRLLSILSFCWLGWRYTPAAAKWLRSRWAAPLVLLGQHSLPVFVVSVFMDLAGQAWFMVHTDLLSQIVVQGVGSVLLVGFGAWVAWRGREKRTPVPVGAVADTAT
jgi:hypothetical protein